MDEITHTRIPSARSGGAKIDSSAWVLVMSPKGLRARPAMALIWGARSSRPLRRRPPGP